jgi:hypothetical protein
MERPFLCPRADVDGVEIIVVGAKIDDAIIYGRLAEYLATGLE